jgi:glycosyltransferase involved in cell wall biosynthesis
MNKFIRLCQNETLIASIPKFVENLKISIIIPVFNAQKYLKKTIRSIQNQKMDEIEIIIVDDFSSDNTSELVLKLQEEDPRIKYIKNKENRGTLYSRSIGALNAKSKYIMTIDNDDLFLPGIFNISYEEAEINDIDILEFSGCDISMNSFVRKCIQCFFLSFKRNGIIITQPELSTYIYRKDKRINAEAEYKIIDAYLWGKIIKSSIYKKALETIGEEIYSQYICYCEDRLVNFALFRVANTFKYIKRYGIIHYMNPTSVIYTWKNKTDKILHDELINVGSIYKLTKNTNDSFLTAVQFQFMWKYAENGISPENQKIAQKIIKEMLNDTFIPEFRKQQIIETVKDKIDLKY